MFLATLDISRLLSIDRTNEKPGCCKLDLSRIHPCTIDVHYLIYRHGSLIEHFILCEPGTK